MNRILHLFLALFLPLCGTLAVSGGEPPAWREQLSQRLPLLGHRNWIVSVGATVSNI